MLAEISCIRILQRSDAPMIDMLHNSTPHRLHRKTNSPLSRWYPGISQNGSWSHCICFTTKTSVSHLSTDGFPPCPLCFSLFVCGSKRDVFRGSSVSGGVRRLRQNILDILEPNAFDYDCNIARRKTILKRHDDAFWWQAQHQSTKKRLRHSLSRARKTSAGVFSAGRGCRNLAFIATLLNTCSSAMVTVRVSE